MPNWNGNTTLYVTKPALDTKNNNEQTTTETLAWAVKVTEPKSYVHSGAILATYEAKKIKTVFHLERIYWLRVFLNTSYWFIREIAQV